VAYRERAPRGEDAVDYVVRRLGAALVRVGDRFESGDEVAMRAGDLLRRVELAQSLRGGVQRRWRAARRARLGDLTLVPAAVIWSGEWWNWCLAAIGLAGISPWPGVGAGAQPSSSS
jgi:hypothetical protein